MQKQTKGSILLLLCAMIWGAAFVAQSEGMQYVGPFTMGATRFFLAGLVLLPVIAVLDRKGWSQNRAVTQSDKKKQLLAGVICGVLLFAATTLQQFGLLDTTVGKSGFVTALYIVFVPILGAVIGKRAGLRVWLCALAAVCGMYLLCVGSGFSVSGGDLLTLGCAVLFAIHICYVGAVVPHMDGVRLSCVQFLVCSALSAVGMLLFEAPDWGSILQCWWPIVYAGVFSGGVAYTFQIIGERDVQPTLASLLMPGIRLCRPVRLAAARPNALRTGTVRLRGHVRGDHSVAAAGEAEGRCVKRPGTVLPYRVLFIGAVGRGGAPPDGQLKICTAFCRGRCLHRPLQTDM